MTSFSANRKTSLYRNWCMIDVWLPLNIDIKSRSLFQNPQLLVTLQRHLVKITPQRHSQLTKNSIIAGNLISKTAKINVKNPSL